MSRRRRSKLQKKHEGYNNSVKYVTIIPRSKTQKELLRTINNPENSICFAVGPAGCGKTWLSTLTSIQGLQDGMYKRIVITRPNVAVDDRDIGFLPGDMFKKMTPWSLPILDIFNEYYSYREMDTMFQNGILEICPIAYIRGRTFKDAFIIVDEAQGTTKKSMMSILTRIGENSRMVVTGDLDQSDFGHENGLSDFLNRFGGNSERIKVVRFNNSDVERHPVIKEVLDIYK